MKSVLKLALIVLTALALSLPLAVAAQGTPEQVLFTNIHVFDGVNKKRIENANVLVEGNKIKTVSTEAIQAPGAAVIDGGGRTLLPGFIEVHAHLMLMGPSLPAMEGNTTWEDFAIHGTRMAEMYLMQGFTTVRDAGGANGGLRRAIDAGEIVGPRYYPSGAFLSTRAGTPISGTTPRRPESRRISAA
jgi:imidazolonepropionase-like amidohydrolase